MNITLRSSSVLVRFLTLILFSLLFVSCVEENVRLADLDSDYTDLGLTRGEIALWEDGMRLDLESTEPSEWEWWYFDGTFDDGSSFVASFHPKIEMDPTKPFAKLIIIPPGGEAINRYMWGDHSVSSYSRETCKFNIGQDLSVWTDDGDTYHIKSKIDDLAIDLVLTRQVKAFRPETGYIYLGDNDEQYMSWISMIPKGTMTGKITYNGQTHNVTGMGYHDHQWGTISSGDCISQWWWMRGYIEDSAVIVFDFGFKKKYGSKHIPILGIVNSADVFCTTDAASGLSIYGDDWGFPDDPDYSRRLKDRIPFTINIEAGDCTEGESCLESQFKSKTLIESMDLLAVQDLTETQLQLMKFFSIDPWYTRYTGSVTLDLTNFNGWNLKGEGNAIIEFDDLE